MKIIADLHVHSKYARAVSNRMELENMARWGDRKGIDLMATGDWTHPEWIKEIESKLEEGVDGVFKLKNGKYKTRFILSTEISNIFKQDGQTRRIHTLFMAPSIEVVKKINKELVKRGGNLKSDGRPILGLNLKEMCELVWGVDEEVLIVPAHIWTPWYALFGSKSGFDSIKQAFGKYSDRIYAIETGLSSDPEANWQIDELENRTMVSFSDAHSPEKIGREVTVLASKTDVGEITFNDLREALKERSQDGNQGNFKIKETIEFYPEEGKYHYSGHRKCGVRQTPSETEKKGEVCHVCGKKMTLGVMHRIKELIKGDYSDSRSEIKQQSGVKKYFDRQDEGRPGYVKIVPLQEIISEAVDVGVNSKTVQRIYDKLIDQVGNELEVLLSSDVKDIKKVAGERVGEGVNKVRKSDLVVEPGYDGKFGVVKIWSDGDEQDGLTKANNQKMLF